MNTFPKSHDLAKIVYNLPYYSLESITVQIPTKTFENLTNPEYAAEIAGRLISNSIDLAYRGELPDVFVYTDDLVQKLTIITQATAPANFAYASAEEFQEEREAESCGIRDYRDTLNTLVATVIEAVLADDTTPEFSRSGRFR